jgi:hypothetical protein
MPIKAVKPTEKLTTSQQLQTKNTQSRQVALDLLDKVFSQETVQEQKGLEQHKLTRISLTLKKSKTVF